jgi:FKBP-type peptidyl-prolyl cis-trans isomerase
MKSAFRILFAMCVLHLAVPGFAADPKLETEDEKTIYALGLLLSDSLKAYNLNPGELEILKAGLMDGATQKEPKVNAQEYRQKLQQLAQSRAAAIAEKEKTDAVSFLEQAGKEKGAAKTESGLIYIELTPGTGESPKETDRVKVHYHGTLRDGTVFDSSVDRGSPATFPLNRVIKCWTEGVQKMKVGGKSKLICPSDIAYGDRGAPPKIKPGAPLIFEVELISIEAEAPQKPAGHP